jgi:hypothetical protein
MVGRGPEFKVNFKAFDREEKQIQNFSLSVLCASRRRTIPLLVRPNFLPPATTVEYVILSDPSSLVDQSLVTVSISLSNLS